MIRTFKKLAPSCSLKIVFKATNRLSTCFSFKDKFPKSLSFGVIYQYTCATCNRSYIGSSKRYWEKRLEEHIHVSSLTGKPLRGLQTYAPLNHVQKNCQHENPVMGRNDFRIIGRESNPWLLQVKESILIYKLKPELNDNNACVPLNLCKPC